MLCDDEECAGKKAVEKIQSIQSTRTCDLALPQGVFNDFLFPTSMLMPSADVHYETTDLTCNSHTTEPLLLLHLLIHQIENSANEFIPAITKMLIDI